MTTLVLEGRFPFAAIILIGMTISCTTPGLSETRNPIRLGETTIDIVEYTSGAPGRRYIVLHENEQTAVEAALQVIRADGGSLVMLQQAGERNLTFPLNGTTYTVDPNRIFTRDGIVASLTHLGPVSEEAVRAVEVIADTLTHFFALEKTPLVVTVHNNTEGEYSTLSYLEGGDEVGNALRVHREPGVPIDDFFFVTTVTLFEKLKAAGFNVVLQDNEGARDDGSLSVYCGKRNLPYLNAEAQHGHLDEQIEMLKVLREIEY